MKAARKCNQSVSISYRTRTLYAIQWASSRQLTFYGLWAFAHPLLFGSSLGKRMNFHIFSQASQVTSRLHKFRFPGSEKKLRKQHGAHQRHQPILRPHRSQHIFVARPRSVDTKRGNSLEIMGKSEEDIGKIWEDPLQMRWTYGKII